MRVLVIEDYEVVREAIHASLVEHGFAVDATGSGTDGAWLAHEHDYDVIVLDLMLPGLDGVTILSRLRAAGRTAAVLVLTARTALEERVRALDLGADDYLVKPFDLAELVARVRAMVRRRYQTSAPRIRVADLELDTARRELRRAGEVIALSAREYALLEYLALRAGELVTRTEIWEHVYDFRSSATSNVVDVYVGYLRRKLEAHGPRLIHTRRGQGYTLEAHLEP